MHALRPVYMINANCGAHCGSNCFQRFSAVATENEMQWNCSIPPTTVSSVQYVLNPHRKSVS